jgi:hypothetical protein
MSPRWTFSLFDLDRFTPQQKDTKAATIAALQMRSYLRNGDRGRKAAI